MFRGVFAGGPLFCLERAGRERLGTLREHTGHLLHRFQSVRGLLLTAGRSRHLLPGTFVKRQIADVLHFGRNEYFLLPGKPNTELPHRSLSESDYEPLYEPTAVVISRQEVALRQKVLGENRQRYICFFVHILLRRDLTSTYVLDMCNGIAGWYGFNKLALRSVFALFLHSRKGYNSPSFEREVLWLRGRRSGAHGLQARFAS
jgi:hypothetical protein